MNGGTYAPWVPHISILRCGILAKPEMELTHEPAEELNLEGLVTGHDFSRADRANQLNGALAPEVCSYPSRQIPNLFSVPEVCSYPSRQIPNLFSALRQFKRSPALLLAASLLTVSAHAADPLTSAHAALQAGKADEATSLLNQALKTNPNDAQANHLLCRVEYSLQHFDQAAEHCEKAVHADPNNAGYHLWLGSAIGERASRASFLSAFSLAKRTREEFETAVKLDPRNVEALADLGEFDKEAPGAVGGGIDKAEDVAKKLDAIDSSRAHTLRAEIAEKQKNLPEAEQQFKAAITGPRSALAWMELANFYRRHERWSDLDAAVNSGAAVAVKEKHAAIAYANGAGILARANRNPQLAIKFYTSYLASPDKSEEAPAFEVLTKLARLREKNGDHEGALRDQAAALALAHDYKPAQDISPQEHKH